MDHTTHIPSDRTVHQNAHRGDDKTGAPLVPSASATASASLNEAHQSTFTRRDLQGDMRDLLDSHFAQVETIISPVYLVGGPVRDALLGKVPQDFDYTTPLLPEQVEEKIREAGRRPYKMGARFGTLGFKLDGSLVEVTTFRDEVYKPGSRHPEVTFGCDLHEDLARRDFTINALAYNGELHDPFGGRADLERRVIRAVGSPAQRMTEDPLRMLRAARFCAQLGFSCDPELLHTLTELRHCVLSISAQRMCHELTRLICAPYPLLGIAVFAQSGLLNLIFPELAHLAHPEGALEIGRALNKVAPEPAARWAVICAHMSESLRGKRCSLENAHLCAQECCKRLSHLLCWSKAHTAAVTDELDKKWTFYTRLNYKL